MLFDFDVIDIFGDGISVLDNRLTPVLVEHGSPDWNGYRQNNPSPRRGRHDSIRKERLYHVIDKMGEASAKAQNLHASITGGSRMVQCEHHLYVMVDRKTNSDRGTVVGILKVGHKTLFVYDRNNRQREMYPLCVLDFYVHETRQRTGCGKKLFDSMLTRERVRPEHLAIDRPSHKFSSFLRKHYDLNAVVPQVNNFVVFDGFFTNRTDDEIRRVGSVFSRPPTQPARIRPFSHYDRMSQCPFADHNYLVNDIFAQLGGVLWCRCGQNSSYAKYQLTNVTCSWSEPFLPEIKTTPRTEVKAISKPEVKLIEKAEITSNRPYELTNGRYVPSIITPEPGFAFVLPSDRDPVICRPRDGPSTDYRHFLSELNQHQMYQDRRGRLLVPHGRADVTPAIGVHGQSDPISIPSRDTSSQSIAANPHARSLPANHVNAWRDQSQTMATRLDQSERSKPSGQSTSWTVFGTPPSYHGRKWQHTKLW